MAGREAWITLAALLLGACKYPSETRGPAATVASAAPLPTPDAGVGVVAKATLAPAVGKGACSLSWDLPPPARHVPPRYAHDVAFLPMQAMPLPKGVSDRDPRRSFSYWAGGRLVVFGRGDKEMWGALYDPASDRWTAVAAQAIPSDADAALVGDEIVFFHRSSGVFVLDVARNRWRTTPAPEVPVTGDVRVAFQNGALLLLASRGDPLFGAIYVVATGKWIRVPRDPSLAEWASDGLDILWTGAHILALGLESDTPRIGTVFDAAAGTWRAMNGAGAPSPRTQSGYAWGAGRLVAGLGENSNGKNLSDLAAYDPIADCWAPMAPAPIAGGAAWISWIPSSQRFAVRVDDAKDMALFEPRAGVWTRLPLRAEPIEYPTEPRASESYPPPRVTDTGDLLFASANGAIFRVRERRWEPIRVAPAPWRPQSPSYPNGYHGVWTGTRFLFWGGERLVKDFPCPPSPPDGPTCDPHAEMATIFGGHRSSSILAP